ncbi:lantibiotic dehydratase [Amycolatopsis mediterranei]|uniref:lantibiotic dehydratase n=1 Tax=Amycolatopsis mediterranei TaxID=33910 RepID=UPI00341F311C
MTGDGWIPLRAPDGDPSTWSVWPVLMFRTAGTEATRALTFSAPDDEAFLPVEELAELARRVVEDPWFQEALTWQNPHVVETWVEEVHTSVRPAVLRRRNSKIAMFLQRYATKNDTIGFFGPVGWARLDQDAPGVLPVVGKGDEVHRHSYFEPWVIETLARRWENDPRLRPWLRPRADPSATLAGTTVLRAHGERLELTEEDAAVFAACDGRTTSAAIAKALPGHRTTEAVLSAVDRLAAAGVVRAGFQLPLDVRQDEHLAEQLATAEDPAAAAYLAELRALQDGRHAVDEAAGSPVRLRAALADLRTRYAAMSGRAPEIRKNERPDGRSMLWADTLSDWDPVLGADALRELQGPLSMVLDACRWATARIAAGFEADVLELLAEEGGRPLPFEVLFDELRPQLTGRRLPAAEETTLRLQEIVAGLVDLPADARTVELRAEDLWPAWRAAFAAPGPGWPGAAVHSPDVMLAARGADAIEAGEHLWVLGEVHAAFNTLDMPLAVLNARDFVDVEAAVRSSTPPVRYAPALPRTWARITPRSLPMPGITLPDRDVHWTLWPEDVLARTARIVPGTALTVDAPDGTPMVHGPGVRARLVDLVGTFLSIGATGVFRPFALAPHTPRVVVDRLVLQRERWCLPLGELAAVLRKSGGEAEVAARLRAAGVPRFSFVRFPREPKPFFCDLRSEPLLKNVVRLVRGGPDTDVVSVEEMLPGFEDLWLTKDDGRRFTSEFRLVGLDGLRGFPS